MQKIDPMPFPGVDSGLRVIRFAKAERELLRRAASLLDRARELRRGFTDEFDYDPDEIDCDLGIGSYICDEIAQHGDLEA